MSDDELEAVHRDVMHAAEHELGRSFTTLPAVQPDPEFDEATPGLAVRWRAHSDARTLTLVCGAGGCAEKVGEVRGDPGNAIVLLYRTIGEIEVEQPTRVTRATLGFDPGAVCDADGKTLAELQQRKLDAFHERALRAGRAGRYIMKRDRHPRSCLWPLHMPGIVATCPKHGTRAVRQGLPDDLGGRLRSPKLSRAQRRVVVF